MQAAFLAERPPPEPTLDGEPGGAVTPSDGDFTINDRLLVAPHVLVRRLNEKKAKVGQRAFPSEVWSSQHVPHRPGGAGAAGHCGVSPTVEVAALQPTAFRCVDPFLSKGKMFS
jgi:hypothetical protein